MSEPDDADQSETHPEITALLRDEPVAVDPARREAAIDAALELGAVLWPAEEPADELAARRHVAPVPAPRRASSGGPRRVALVAAAVAVIAGLGIAGMAAIQGDGDFLAVSGSGDDSADSAGSAAESAPADADGSGSAGGAESSAQAEDRPQVPEELLTTTAPASLGASADLGSFESVESLLDALVATGYRSAAPGASEDQAAIARLQGCAELSASGLTAIGRATVASQPVLVAATGPDASVLVVVDATTCAELGRR